AESVARAALETELDRERAARAALAAALDGAREELAATRAVRADLVLTREEARAEAAAARADATAARAALEAAQADAAAARAERDAALAEAGSLRSALEAARADAAAVRSAYDAAAADAAAVRAAYDAAAADGVAVRATLEAAQGEISALTTARDAAQRALGDVESERDDVAAEALALQEELGTLRDEVAAATAARDRAGGLLERIAELEAAGDADLTGRAKAQAAATRAAGRDAPAPELAARFDAAAAALRDRAPEEPDPASASAAGAKAEPTEAAPAERAAPRIVSERGGPPRADLVGRSQRTYPWLRGALVKLAHDDPRAAARLLLQLVPAHAAIAGEPLEYDLTIREAGSHAISVSEGRATATPIDFPRARSVAAFHAAADAVTLAELLAGVPKRLGRWRGPVRVHGRRHGAELVRDLLAGSDLSLAAAARAGAALEPDLVFRLFAYAIQPAWTAGYAFTVAQEVTDPQPARWFVTVADGAAVAVARRAPQRPADATVVMTRAAFDRLLRDEPAAAGERPVVRGDRAAVAALKAWTDRAQGR
ncbi:MAG TPA: alkyl sulfatase C-terminal domain-containing protein, partial [Solirubrobacteraceae bacterium]|nr:alkyl sulfatase C-terminal domain-containing protein [Solirubrobacteraceae bacterium]